MFIIALNLQRERRKKRRKKKQQQKRKKMIINFQKLNMLLSQLQQILQEHSWVLLLHQDLQPLLLQLPLVYILMLSKCSKLFYIILSKYFYFVLRSCTAIACPALSHIAHYDPSHRTNNYGTTMQFKCKNNFEHLLKQFTKQHNLTAT